MSVYSLQVHCDCSKNSFHLKFQEKKKALTLAEYVKVIDLVVKGKIACNIALYLSLGIGKVQIKGILAKKILILKFWKAETNNNLLYLAAKQNKNGNLIHWRVKPASAWVLRQLGSVVLDCVLFLLFFLL